MANTYSKRGRLFRVDSLYSGSPTCEDESVKAIDSAGPAASLILVFSPGELKQLKKLSEKIPGLSEELPLFESPGKSRLISFNHGNRTFIIFIVKSFNDYIYLLKRLTEMKEVPQKPTVIAEIRF